jgi:large subunit ribosomal protein L15
MLSITSLDRVKGKKSKKRYGLGFSAGSKTCGRGQKGQLSRSGGGRPYVGFEGGQTPIFRRVPKRGFNNFARVEFVPVNIASLNQFENGTEVTPELLREIGIVKKVSDLVKILGDGELEKQLTVSAHKFSKSAVSKITNAGGTVKVL